MCKFIKGSETMSEYKRPKEIQFHTTRQEAYVENWTKFLFCEEKFAFKPLQISASLSLAISAIIGIILSILHLRVLYTVILMIAAFAISMIIFREAFLCLYKSIKFREYTVDIKIDDTKILIKDSRKSAEILIYHNAIADIHCGFETDWDEKMVFYITEQTAEGTKEHKLSCLDDAGKDIMLALCDYSNIKQSYYMR